MSNSPAAEPTVVHIVDDDDAMRESLAFLMESSGLEVQAHAAAEAFLACAARSHAGCIVTDVRMPGMSGVELLRRLKTENGLLPVIVITGHGDISLAVGAMKAGAFDFLEKPFEEEQLLTAVREALAWRGSAVEQREKIIAIQARFEALSEREREVLDGLVVGHPNKTIAYDLGISPRTVEVYRAKVMAKLQAKTLSEVIRMAVLAGLDGGGDQPA